MMVQDIRITLATEIMQVTGTVNSVSVTWNRQGDEWVTSCDKSKDGKYLVEITAITAQAKQYDYAFTLYYGLVLITDRTQADVDRVKRLRKKWAAGTITQAEKDEWFSEMKGAYNASDLNRVGSAIRYINQRLLEAGYGKELEIKADWRETDNNYIGSLDYYLQAVRQLRSWFTTMENTPAVPDDMQNLTYIEANNIEKILMDLDFLITQMGKSFFYSGEIASGEV